MSFRKRGFRIGVLGLLGAAGLALAPAAFAGHVSVGVGIGLPGLSIGYSDCHRCGWGGRGYVSAGYWGNYYGGYYPVAPVYYGGYYDSYRGYGMGYRHPVVVRHDYPGHYYRAGYYEHDRSYHRDGYR